jgi:thymidylate kinase
MHESTDIHMVTIALVGPDGAGKTSIARRLEAEFDGRAKYLYMGNNAASSNISLPTTRAVNRAKVRQAQRSTSMTRAEAETSLHGLEHRRRVRGLPWRLARLANRIVEASVRQVLASLYSARGSVVIFDRHPRFEFGQPDKPSKQATENIHRWFLWSVLPEPDLVFLLDAPAEELYARKQEVPVEFLEKARRRYKAICATCENTIEIDVQRSLDDVVSEIQLHMNVILPSTKPKEETA